MDFIQDFISAVIGSATELASGLGQAIPQFFESVFTTSNGGANIFAIVVAMFLGVSFLTWITATALRKLT